MPNSQGIHMLHHLQPILPSLQLISNFYFENEMNTLYCEGSCYGAGCIPRIQPKQDITRIYSTLTKQLSGKLEHFFNQTIM